MASILSAGTTSATALNMSADTSGVLQLASNNGTVGLTLDTSQNVGIGTSSPTAVLHTIGPNGSYATTLAETVTYTKLRFQNSSASSLSLFQGVTNSSSAAWYFQIANGPGTGAYDIALNPFGGNVGIGTNSPAGKLDVSGNIYVSGKQLSNGPSFSVSANGSSQSISAGTTTKLTNLTTTATANTYYWDTNSCWDNTNKRFTPNIAGYYIFNGTVAVAGISSGANIGAEIQKNGGGKTGFRFNNGGANDAYINVTCMYYMNGSTDYVELYVNNLTAGSINVRAEAASVWFNGAMVRSA